MKIITTDGKSWDAKYIQSREQISFEVGTKISNFPSFTGSKLHQNSSGSDKYSLNFTIHKTQIVAFRESFKKFVTDESKAVIHPIYGKLLNIILEHDEWGAIAGKIISSPTFATGSKADILVTCSFQEETLDEPLPQRDFEIENADSLGAIDAETQLNFDVELTALDKTGISKFADKLSGLYSNIQNSKVVSAFNDLNSQLSKALLDSKKIMRSFKNIISLPNEIFSQTTNKLDLFKAQANAIKEVPVTSFNMAKFNINTLSFNLASTNRTVYVSPTALAAAGVKVVPLN